MNQMVSAKGERSCCCYQLGSLRIDLKEKKVYRANGSLVEVAGKNFQMLAVLLLASPETVSIAELHEKVWPDRCVGDDTVRQRVKLLRQALSGNSTHDTLIEVDHGNGYSVNATLLTAAPHHSQKLPQKKLIGKIFAVAVLMSLILLSVFNYIENIAPDNKLRVYVQPFTALQIDDHLLASGFTGELIDKLVPVSGLTVTGQKGNNDKEINAIIEGSIRQAEGLLHIQVRIVDSTNGNYLWVKQYNERLLTDIYEIQANIAAHVALILQVTFDDEIYELILNGPTSNIDAYYHYLRGRGSLIQNDKVLAIREFENSLKADPEFKLAKLALLKLDD
jgi:DNA-binding winged helix-turn-helix (wHTH) protein/TolB-like protein